MKAFYVILVLISASATILGQGMLRPNDSISVNQTVMDSVHGSEYLVGFCDREGLIQSPEFGANYNNEYESYHPEVGECMNYRDSINQYEILIVLGVWCSDSQREVPRFLKFLDVIDFPFENYAIIAVDRNKAANIPGLSELKIDFVPTIIFYKNGVEVGRIIETPAETLEGDFVKIIKEN